MPRKKLPDRCDLRLLTPGQRRQLEQGASSHWPAAALKHLKNCGLVGRSTKIKFCRRSSANIRVEGHSPGGWSVEPNGRLRITTSTLRVIEQSQRDQCFAGFLHSDVVFVDVLGRTVPWQMPELDYLRRHNLLQPGELERAKEADGDE